MPLAQSPQTIARTERCRRVGLVPGPFAGTTVYAVSCIGLKIILKMLRFHLLPEPASSAIQESHACDTRACGLVATGLHPTRHHEAESGCPWEGQNGAQHFAGLPAPASPPPGSACSPGTKPWLSITHRTMPAHPTGRKWFIFVSCSFSNSTKGTVSPGVRGGQAPSAHSGPQQVSRAPSPPHALLDAPKTA